MDTEQINIVVARIKKSTEIKKINLVDGYMDLKHTIMQIEQFEEVLDILALFTSEIILADTYPEIVILTDPAEDVTLSNGYSIAVPIDNTTIVTNAVFTKEYADYIDEPEINGFHMKLTTIDNDRPIPIVLLKKLLKTLYDSSYEDDMGLNDGGRPVRLHWKPNDFLEPLAAITLRLYPMIAEADVDEGFVVLESTEIDLNDLREILLVIQKLTKQISIFNEGTLEATEDMILELFVDEEMAKKTKDQVLASMNENISFDGDDDFIWYIRIVGGEINIEHLITFIDVLLEVVIDDYVLFRGEYDAAPMMISWNVPDENIEALDDDMFM